MKKLMTILVVTLFIAVSCNSKDDKPKTDSEKIVGTRKPVKYVEDECEGEIPDIEIPNSCESSTRIIFNSDGTGIGQESEIDLTGNCIITDINFNWNITNGNLVITIEDDVNILDYFEVSNTTLKVGETYTEDNITCKSYSVFEKVN